MDGGAWKAAVHGVAKSRTGLSNFTFTFHFHALEKEMATHSSVLAWRIPGTGEPGGLLSMGSQSQTRLKRLSSSSSTHRSPILTRHYSKSFKYISSFNPHSNPKQWVFHYFHFTDELRGALNKEAICPRVWHSMLEWEYKSGLTSSYS